MAQVKNPETGVYIAISSGVFKVKGRTYEYFRGKTYPADFPLIRIRPDSFRPLTFPDKVTA